MLCVRGHVLHAHRDRAARSLGGGRLEKAVVDAFLDAVTPAGVDRDRRRDPRARATSTSSCSPVSASRWSAPSIEAERAERQFDACEPENRLVARTLERKLEDALAEVERERGKLAALEHARPAPLTDAERDALADSRAISRGCGRRTTTTDRDRKELLRTLIREIVVTVNARAATAPTSRSLGRRRAHRADASSSTRRGPERHRLGEDTIELIRRLAEHHPDHQIAAILNRQGRRTGTGLPFTARTRPRPPGQRAGIPAAPPPDPDSRPRHDPAGRRRARRRPVHDPSLAAAKDCSPASRSRRTRRGGSDSPTRSAPGSCPTSPTGICRSTTPPGCSAAPARPCCIRSNAASCKRSTSPPAAAKASESRFPPPSLDRLLN